MCNFEKQILAALGNLNIKLVEPLRLGVAVSGGADSVSMLIALANILYEYKLPLFVISVNHNIREESETAGDVVFVKNLCESLMSQGKFVHFYSYDIPRGKVQKIAAERKAGIEESARFLRYEAFETFIQDYNLDFLCLAHNKNDQLETSLMRFLQGSSLEGLGGIKAQRGKYIRPLLNVNRYEIESYLNEQNVCWRTDSTNLETQYLRNKIRLKLIPLLDAEFPGWKSAVESGVEHLSKDSEVISECVDNFEFEENNSEIVFNKYDFLKEKEAVQVRLLRKFFNKVGEGNRIPYDFLLDFINSLSKDSDKFLRKSFGSAEILSKKDCVFVKKVYKSHTELSFFDIIEESGSYLFPFGKITVELRDNKGKVFLDNSDCKIEMDFPFIVRNATLDDEIKMADSTMKKIVDVYSDWHVPEEQRALIPIFQNMKNSQQPVIAVIGSVLGYKDWIVKL